MNFFKTTGLRFLTIWSTMVTGATIGHLAFGKCITWSQIVTMLCAAVITTVILSRFTRR